MPVITNPVKEAGTIDVKDRTDLTVPAEVYLKKGGGRFFKSGGLWIYDNEIGRISGENFSDGDILTVRDHDSYFLGYGFINRASTIRIRMMSRREDEPVSTALLYARVKNAWEYRKKVIDTSSCRLVFGEADFLPGFTVDKYEDVLVVESLALGTDRLKTLILGLIVRVLAEDGIGIRGIYERSDAKVREKEGMERFTGFIGEPFDTNVPITENGVRYPPPLPRGKGARLLHSHRLLRPERRRRRRLLRAGRGRLGPGHRSGEGERRLKRRG